MSKKTELLLFITNKIYASNFFIDLHMCVQP